MIKVGGLRRSRKKRHRKKIQSAYGPIIDGMIDNMISCIKPDKVKMRFPENYIKLYTFF